MNESIPNPPPLPAGGIPPTPPTPEPPPAIRGILGAVESLVRHPEHLPFHLGQQGVGAILGRLLVVVLACGLFYGFIVGTFSGHEQLWRAPLKLTGGLLFAGLICLPSLYVFACLGGARVTLAEVAGLLGGVLALMTVLLLSFAPVAWVFSQSTDSLVAMGFLHLVLGAVALIFGLRLLHRGFERLEARHFGGLGCWMILFVLVVLQMTTALRPLIGRADTFLPEEKRFFLQHWSDCLDGRYQVRATE